MTNTILTLAIPVLALIGTIFSIFVGPNIAAKSAHKIMVSQMKQQWIQNLRANLADVCNQAYNLEYAIKSNDIRNEEMMELVVKFTQAAHQIIFLLDDTKKAHSELFNSIHKLNQYLVNNDNSKFHKYQALIKSQGLEIIQSELDLIEKL